MSPTVTSGEPLPQDEQDTVFQIGAEMGSRLAESMGACLSIDHGPEAVRSAVEVWEEKFRTNFKAIMAMAPDEYDRYVAHRREQERKGQILLDYQRAKRKLQDAQWTLRHARDAAMKEGLL